MDLFFCKWAQRAKKRSPFVKVLAAEFQAGSDTAFLAAFPQDSASKEYLAAFPIDRAKKGVSCSVSR